MKVDLKYVLQDVDRYGNVRTYFRRRGFRKVRIRHPVDSAAFMAVYEDLKALTDQGLPIGAEPGKRRTAVKPNTWRALCLGYFESDPYKAKEQLTQYQERKIIEQTYDEPLKPGSSLTFGQMPIDRFGAKAVKVLRDRKKSTPSAANNRLKAISAVFNWAADDDEYPDVAANPTRGVNRFPTPGDGYHTWLMSEVRQFQQCHPVGSKGYLALSLFLLLGVRRSDVVRIGPAMRHGDRLQFTAWKNRNRSPNRIDLPILPALDEILDASPIGAETYLQTAYGKPFSVNGFGNWFKDRCVEADLPHCSAHGLRKAGSTWAAENGATTHQLMAMFGWKDIAEAERYTRRAERARLADDGMPLIGQSFEAM